MSLRILGRHRRPEDVRRGPRRTSLLGFPMWVVEVRYIQRDELGRPVRETVTSSWPYIERDLALEEFSRLLRIGLGAYAAGRWRLVLRATDAESIYSGGTR